MNSFFYIANKIVDTQIQCFQQKILFLFLKTTGKIPPSKTKFNDLQYILENPFLTDDDRSEYIRIFGKIQKTYHALNKFAYIYKYKHSNINVGVDLCLNIINEGEPNVICIMDKKTRYLFNIRELVTIIHNGLSSSYFFFPNPKTAKNPYTNMPFNKSTLYNIYFFVKFKTNLYPEMFNKFFDCNFNIKLFSQKYDYVVREYILSKYVKTSSVDEMYDEIKYMLDVLNDTPSLRIHICVDDNFPKKRLVEIMKPYLSLWISSMYSQIATVKQSNFKCLAKKITEFYKYNPAFGRRFVRIVPNPMQWKKTTLVEEFNDKHIKFHTHATNFMKNHLTK